MGLYKVKNLYVNGCSFTAGDNLEDGFTWPELLAKKMNLDLNCRAVNGSSMDTIFYNTINHLQHFDSKDTYVVIGITWPERFGVFFDRVLLNVTPADLDNKLWETKISTFRRMSGPTLETIEKIDEYYPQIQHTKNYKKVLNAFLEYFKELMTYDPNLIEHSWIKMLTQVLALDSYLNDNGFKHKFVGWNLLDNIPTQSKPKIGDDGSRIDSHYVKDVLLPQIKKLDIIDFPQKFGGKNEKGLHNSHPNEEDCIHISKRIYDSING